MMQFTNGRKMMESLVDATIPKEIGLELMEEAFLLPAAASIKGHPFRPYDTIYEAFAPLLRPPISKCCCAFGFNFILVFFSVIP